MDTIRVLEKYSPKSFAIYSDGGSMEKIKEKIEQLLKDEKVKKRWIQKLKGKGVPGFCIGNEFLDKVRSLFKKHSNTASVAKAKSISKLVSEDDYEDEKDSKKSHRHDKDNDGGSNDKESDNDKGSNDKGSDNDKGSNDRESDKERDEESESNNRKSKRKNESESEKDDDNESDDGGSDDGGSEDKESEEDDDRKSDDESDHDDTEDEKNKEESEDPMALYVRSVHSPKISSKVDNIQRSYYRGHNTRGDESHHSSHRESRHGSLREPHRESHRSRKDDDHEEDSESDRKHRSRRETRKESKKETRKESEKRRRKHTESEEEEVPEDTPDVSSSEEEPSEKVNKDRKDRKDRNDRKNSNRNGRYIEQVHPRLNSSDNMRLRNTQNESSGSVVRERPSSRVRKNDEEAPREQAPRTRRSERAPAIELSEHSDDLQNKKSISKESRRLSRLL